MKKTLTLIVAGMLILAAQTAQAAYHHMDEQDGPKFQQAYPSLVGTKVDSCTLCHSGGQYEKKPGKFATVGSCQWCHMTYGYDGSGDISETMNAYGEDYRLAGRSLSAFASIESQDSDNDTYNNKEELDAVTFPGDPDDDPSKVPAPRIVYTLEELEAMDTHSQFMLMNTSRGGTDGCDFYGEYEGVTVETLLREAGMDSRSETVTVFCPDGWSQTFDKESGGESYWVIGEYPQTTYYYDATADKANGGWVDYSAPGCQGREHGQIITNEAGLQCIVAYKLNGVYLESGYLTSENKLDGEGPYRVVPPQKNPGPPDQQATAENQNVVWPFDLDEEETDHNAGGSPRTSTAIRVEPLPAGTTDFDWNEDGWTYVDNKQIVVYGLLRNGNVSGIVTDALGQGIAKARVSTLRGGYSTLTDSDGTYLLSGVVCGEETATYTLTVSASGYSSLNQNVTVASEETTIADFTLTESDDGITCPSEVAAGDNADLISTYRAFRDVVLSKTPYGRRLISSYYNISAEVAMCLTKAPGLRRRIRSILENALPVVRSLIAGDETQVPPELIAPILEIMTEMQKTGSPQLKRTLRQVKTDIGSGILAQTLSLVLH